MSSPSSPTDFGTPSTARLLRFFWTLMGLIDRRWAVLYALLIAAGRAMPPLAAWALTTQLNVASAKGAWTDLPAWVWAVGGMITVYTVSMVLDWGLRLASLWIFHPVSSRLATRFCNLSLRGLLASDAALIAAHSEAHWAERLERKFDVLGLCSFTFNHIAPPALEAGFALVTLWALSQDLSLFLTASIGVALWLVVNVQAQNVLVNSARRLLHAQGLVYDSTARCARAALMAKVLETQEYLLAQREKTSAIEAQSYAKSRLVQVMSEGLQGLVLALCLSACFAVGAHGLAIHAISPGAFAAAMGLVTACFWQLKNLSYAISGVAQHRGRLGTVFALALQGKAEEQGGTDVATPPARQVPHGLASNVVDQASSCEDSNGSRHRAMDVWMENLPCRNERTEMENRAGHCVNKPLWIQPLARVHLHAGDKVYLVGPSGAGKSTLVQRLLGLQAWPTQVRTNAPALQRHWSWAPQSAPTVPGTLWENIAMGRVDRATAIAVGQRCNVEGDWDAPVPDTLSGGERLRLSSARALCSSKPGLILDEPTAGLDATRERQLMDYLRGLPQTMLLITHRLNAIPPNATVWVLDHGAILEVGVASDLLQQENSPMRGKPRSSVRGRERARRRRPSWGVCCSSMHFLLRNGVNPE